MGGVRKKCTKCFITVDGSNDVCPWCGGELGLHSWWVPPEPTRIVDRRPTSSSDEDAVEEESEEIDRVLLAKEFSGLLSTHEPEADDEPDLEARSAPPPLSIDPVIGWRVWCLTTVGDDLRLVSVFREDRWQPGRAMRAHCHVHQRSQVPEASCSCGLYATSTSRYLAESGVIGQATSVVGTISMWGTIVEHTRGARSEFAYPARLRLVCAECLSEGSGAVEPELVTRSGSRLVASCSEHSVGQSRPFGSAQDVQAQLLSTYAVDILPLDGEARSLTFAVPRPGAAAGPLVIRPNYALLKKIIAAPFVAVGYAYVAVMLLFGALFVLAVTAGIVGSLISAFLPDRAADPSPTLAARSVAPEQIVGLETHRGGRRPPPKPEPPPEIRILCGVGEGDLVRIVTCGRGDDLFGFAEASAPHGPRTDCLKGWVAYSRGPDYWVCWTDFGGGADARRWATTADPFAERKETIDGDR